MKVLHPQLTFGVGGVGWAFPGDRPVSNAELLARSNNEALSPKVQAALDIRIAQTFGFKTRYLAHWPNEALRDDEMHSEGLAAQAVKEALADERNVEAFILGSTTSRRFSGSQATGVLGKFNIEAPAYEIKSGCSTSLASLHLAQSLMLFGYTNVLVSCAETMSKLADPDVRESWFGLADGAAALWLNQQGYGPRFKVQSTVFSTAGTLADLYTTRADLPPTMERVAAGGYYLKGDAAEMRMHAHRYYLKLIDAVLPSPTSRKNIQWIIPHQVSRALIDEVMVETGLKGEVLWDSEEVGNIGGASVLYTLCRAIKAEMFRAGDQILLMSVGGGLSSAAQLWTRI